jgi:DNA (cytosine-5)-methyltransferase 1
MITLGSLFNGIGGWLIAAKRAGIKPIWSSEIEKVPLKVTAEHFPDVAQVGDITNITGYNLKPVDIITLGSPCQNLSVVGDRKGLEGERSSLFFEASRIIHEMREKTGGKYPKYVVWENVVGAFSSNKGMDFRAVIESLTTASIPTPELKWAKAGMVECESGTLGWRTLDAQYWGVPQHRERIFLVNHFGTGGGIDEILFKPQSMPRYSQTSQEGKQNAARRTCGNSQEAVILNDQGGAKTEVTKGKVNCLTAHIYKGAPITSDKIPVLDCTQRRDVVRVYEGMSPTLNAFMGTGGGNVPLVKSYCVSGNTCDHKTNQHGTGVKTNCSFALNTIDRHAVANKNIKLRRLTPLECERLQGLPDNWTAVEGASDSVRYKAIGNGMAQPCADFIISRIAQFMRKGDVCD